MGIYDRDYMRRDYKSPAAKVREELAGNSRWQLFAALGVVALIVALLAWPKKSREQEFAERYSERMDGYQYQSAPVQHEMAPGRIDINKAPLQELVRVPGVGESLAHKIIEKRPFSTMEDLLDVRGVGDVNLSIIRQYVYIDSE